MRPRSGPTSFPEKPRDLPQNPRNSLSVGAAIGIGIVISLVILFCAISVWIFVRRRRRTWAKKRRQDEEAQRSAREMTHITPDEEIARRMREWEEDVKLWNGKREDEVAARASWDDEDEKEDGDVEKEMVYELASPILLIAGKVEVRSAQLAVGGKAFAVELEGCSVVQAKES